MRRSRFLLIALAGLVAATPSLAADDAGTQSPFATGAGNRALGMGGAFVAGADDASALLWNPAGLVGLQRSELQAMQSGDLGVGFTESYATLAIPSWRWGAVGVSFRHFGVDGIEQRDDRNSLVSDGLSESDTEFMVGYARALSPAWHVGAALKLRQQSLAGFNGSGIGMDLGVIVHPGMMAAAGPAWLDRMTWGITARNLIEPNIRLDVESVADPATIGTGIAYRIPMRVGDLLTAEIDVLKTGGVGTRMHLGLEYRMFALAAVRVGINGARMTAGTGLRWRDMTVDYAFEDGPLAEAHRFGVSVPFGRTVADSRIAALQEEDEALQRRLAEAFGRRQAERVNQLIADAEAKLAAGSYTEALDVLAVVATLAPDESRVSPLTARGLNGNASQLERTGEFAAAALAFERTLGVAPGDSIATAGVHRCRAESHRKAARTAEIRQVFAQAMDAFSREDLGVARNQFAEVMRRDPSDTEAARMLERTREAIAQRVTAQTRQAARLIEHGLLKEAEPLLASAAALDPASPELARVRAMLDRARQALRAPVARASEPLASAPGPARPILSDREAEDLYERGVAALRAGRSDEAVRYLELVWAARPAFRQVAGHLKKEYLTRGMESFAAGQLESAVSQWRRILDIDPGDERARGYLDRAQRQMDRSREILGGK
jgi:tetratricopeptide (TPR) repeat protein